MLIEFNITTLLGHTVWYIRQRDSELFFLNTQLYAVSVNIGMLAAVLLCDGPQFLDAFQRLFYHQEAPVVNSHESAESTSSVSFTENVHFHGSTEQHHLNEDLASDDMTADSVENLRAAVEEEEEEDKQTQID